MRKRWLLSMRRWAKFAIIFVCWLGCWAWGVEQNLPSSLCVGFSVTALLELAANTQHCRRLSFICDSIHASATANVIHDIRKSGFQIRWCNLLEVFLLLFCSNDIFLEESCLGKAWITSVRVTQCANYFAWLNQIALCAKRKRRGGKKKRPHLCAHDSLLSQI